MNISDRNKKNIIVISLIICISLITGYFLSSNYDISEQLLTARNRYQDVVNQTNNYLEEHENLINSCNIINYFYITKQKNSGYEIKFEDYFETHNNQGYYDVLSEYIELLGFADVAELKIAAIKEGVDLVVFQLDNARIDDIKAVICKECKVNVKRVDYLISDNVLIENCSIYYAHNKELFYDNLQAKVDIESAKQSKWNLFYFSLTIGIICSTVFYVFRRHKNDEN